MTSDEQSHRGDLTKIVALGKALPEPNNQSGAPESNADLDKSLDEQRRNFDLRSVKETHSLRMNSAIAIFIFVVLWMIFVGWTLHKVANQCNPFFLSDNVIIALLTTTTINVFALLVIVAKWLFPNGHK